MTRKGRPSARQSTTRAALRSILDSLDPGGFPEDLDQTLDSFARTMLARTRPLDILLRPEVVYEHIKDTVNKPPLNDKLFTDVPGLSNQQLHDGVFTRSQFVNIDFSNSVLSGAQLQDAQFVVVNLEHATCRGTDFSRALLHGQRFDEVDLEGAIFEDAEMQGCAFAKAAERRLVRVRFRGALLTGADFKGLDLVGCDFESAWAKSSEISSAKFDRDCILKSAVLAGSQAVKTTFDGCDLDFVDLSWSDMSGAVISGGGGAAGPRKIGFANFSQVRMPSARFANLELIGCSFATDNLVEVMFEDCTLIGCDFTSAVIGEATFRSGCRAIASVTSRNTKGPPTALQFLSAG